jgi:hypothetical protein
MLTGQEQRPRYYEGQYLGADDLTAAVAYARLREARHLLGAHTWGIAAGLQLQEVQPPGGGVDMYVRPGYAWDGFGRPIVVLAPYKIPLELFQAYSYDPSQPDGVLVDVWLRYDEAETQFPRPGFAACDPADQSSRVVETFRLVVGPRLTHASRHDPVSVAGRSIDALEAFRSFDPGDGPLNDESVPFQSFPADGDPALWLIPLGQVHWKPNAVADQPGAFSARTADELAASRARRIYVAAVAESLLAADGILRLADRTRDYRTDPYKAQDLVRVEGALRAEGDARLWGTQLAFLDPKGNDNGVPLALRRTDDTAAGTTRIDVQIGKGASGTTWFGVGPLNAAGGVDEKLVVLDNGNVGIGTTQPIAPFQVSAGSIQVGASGAPGDNFYFSSDTNGGPRGFRLYNKNFGGGTPLLTVLASGNVGVGAKILNPGLPLEIQGDFGCPSQAATMSLWGSRMGDIGSGLLFLRSGGNKVAVDKPGDMFGIRTANPRQALEVAGDSLLASDVNPVLINSTHTGYPNVSFNQAEITNDTNTYKALLIVGNRSALEGVISDPSQSGPGPNLSRKVRVFDILQIDGDLLVTGVPRTLNPGGWTISSDAALKKNIHPLAGALEKLLGLRGVSFEWKDTMGHPARMGPQIGMIAQEVARVFPEWVSTTPDGHKEMTVRGFEALAVEALRELHAELRELRSRVHSLAKEARGEATGHD